MAPKPPESENPQDIIAIGQVIKPFVSLAQQEIPESFESKEFFLPGVGKMTFKIIKPVGTELLEREKGKRNIRRVSAQIVVTEPDANIGNLQRTLGLVVREGETEYLSDQSFAVETKKFDFSYTKKESDSHEAAEEPIYVEAASVPHLQFVLIDVYK